MGPKDSERERERESRPQSNRTRARSVLSTRNYAVRLMRLGDDFFIFFFGAAASSASSSSATRFRGEADDAAGDALLELSFPSSPACASLHGTDGAHVYYFDTNNEFQELGKERKRVVKDDSVPMKRVRRVVDCWVYGPNPKYQLEDGESELVTMAVWVRVPMW